MTTVVSGFRTNHVYLPLLANLRDLNGYRRIPLLSLPPSQSFLGTSEPDIEGAKLAAAAAAPCTENTVM